jgi:hypothetical protein
MTWKEEIRKKVMSHTYGVELDNFTGMRDRLIKKLQELNEYAFGAETDEANLELAIANLGKIIADAKYSYEQFFGSEYYNIDKRRFA